MTLLRSCVEKLRKGEKNTYFSWAPWPVADDDGGRYPSSTWKSGSMPKPIYPDGKDEATYVTGDCVKGWILFESVGEKTTSIRYVNSDGDRAVWRLK